MLPRLMLMLLLLLLLSDDATRSAWLPQSSRRRRRRPSSFWAVAAFGGGPAASTARVKACTTPSTLVALVAQGPPRRRKRCERRTAAVIDSGRPSPLPSTLRSSGSVSDDVDNSSDADDAAGAAFAATTASYGSATSPTLSPAPTYSATAPSVSFTPQPQREGDGGEYDEQHQPPVVRRGPKTKKSYHRKRGIPATEQKVRRDATRRQEAYAKLFPLGGADDDHGSISTTAAPTGLNDCTSSSNNSKKITAASIWSFERLFPAPVWDTESIQSDLLFRATSAAAAAAANVPKTRSNDTNIKTGATTMAMNTTGGATMLPFLPDTAADGVAVAAATASDRSRSSSSNTSSSLLLRKMKSTVDGGSAVMRIGRGDSKPPPQQQPTLSSNSTAVVGVTVSVVAPSKPGSAASPAVRAASPVAPRDSNGRNYNNNNATGQVDPLLTQMVEDRVYGYRRLPTGDLQYETSLLKSGSAVQFREGVRLGNPLPINADILTYQAKKELQHGRVEEASELYEKAVATDPADGRAYLGLSKCAERRRDFALSRKWLIRGVRCSVSMNGPTPDRGANPFLLQALGCLEEKLGHLAQAEALYVKAIQSRPCHAAAWVSLAVLRTRKLGGPVAAGRRCYASAERELTAAGQPASAYVYTSWANLEYHKAGDKAKARDLFQKALQIDPQCSAAWLQLGVLEAACGNWDQAETCFETVRKFDQRNSRVLQAYALMETRRPAGDSRKAIGLFERALLANPRDAGVLQAYALYVADLGDWASARALLRRGTDVNKRDAAVWQAWGVLEARAGHADAARAIFQEGIWACGQMTGGQSGGYHCARLWQAWGVLEAKEDQHAAARRCFSRALDADGRNVPAFTAWALMEEQLGNSKDARMIFERALHKFSPGSDDKMALWRSYELMEQRLGEVEAAQNVYQRSVRETFGTNDESEVVSTESKPRIDDLAVASMSNGTQEPVKLNEFEVVRWESTGGEVWLNERAIEGKVPKRTTKNPRGGKKQP